MSTLRRVVLDRDRVCISRNQIFKDSAIGNRVALEIVRLAGVEISIFPCITRAEPGSVCWSIRTGIEIRGAVSKSDFSYESRAVSGRDQQERTAR